MIIEEFESIINAMTNKPFFIHGLKSYANLAADNLDYTDGAVFLYEPLTCIDRVSGAGTQKTWPILMFFAFKHELVDFPVDVRVQLNKAWALSEQFILSLKGYKYAIDDRRYIKELNSIKRTETTNEYDVNLCGVICTFDLVPLIFDPTCII